MASAIKGLPPLILASSSPRRSELLRQLELSFEIVPSEAREIFDEQLTAREVCLLNAYRKARVVAKKHPDWLVLGADTLVCLDNKVFGKPSGFEEAYRMLEALQGRAHQVITALCLLHLRARRQRLSAETTTVTFRPLDASTIQRYLNLVNPLDKAGAYAIQESGNLLVESISGSFSNVVGLPLERLRAEFEAWTSEQAGARSAVA